jgi:hypothetical protein
MSNEKRDVRRVITQSMRDAEFGDVKSRFFFPATLWETKKTAPRASIYAPEVKQKEMNTKYDRKLKRTQSYNFDDRVNTWQFHRSDKGPKDLRTIDDIERSLNCKSPVWKA